MRQSLIRGVVVLAAVTALSSVAACGNTQNKAACKKINGDLQSVTTKMDPSNPGKAFTDAAAKIRSDASGASGNVKSSADALADDYAKIGKQLSSKAQPDTSSMSGDAKKLGTACGISMSTPSV